MIGLVRAEFLKVRTTQVWIWMLVAAVALAALLVIAPFGAADVSNAHDVSQVFAGASIAYIVVFVLGVLGITTEFRYQTITSTVLVTPSRWTMVTAKMITYLILGALYALACVAVQLAVAIPWAAAKGLDVNWAGDGIPRMLGAVFLVVALFGIVGLGVGALLRNQIVAVSVGVIFLLVLEGILGIIPKVKVIYPYLPGGAANAILEMDPQNSGLDVGLLSPLAGIGVLVLWAIVPAIVGASLTLNRDIT